MSVKVWSLAILIALVANLAAARQFFNSDGAVATRSWNSRSSPGSDVLTFLWKPIFPVSSTTHVLEALCWRADFQGSNPVAVRGVLLAGTDSGNELQIGGAKRKMNGGLALFSWDVTGAVRSRFANDEFVVVIGELAVTGKTPGHISVTCELHVSEIS